MSLGNHKAFRETTCGTGSEGETVAAAAALCLSEETICSKCTGVRSPGATAADPPDFMRIFIKINLARVD